MLDISVRRRAEKILQGTNTRLRRTQLRLKSIFEAVADGIILVNDAGIVETFNPAAQDIFGCSSSEAIGEKITFLIPPDTTESYNNYLSSFIPSDAGQSLGKNHYVKGIHKLGYAIPLSVNIARMEIEGQVYFTGVLRDITETLERENALGEANRRLELAEEVSNLGHWYLELQTSTTTWSEQLYHIHGVLTESFTPHA